MFIGVINVSNEHDNNLLFVTSPKGIELSLLLATIAQKRDLPIGPLGEM